MSNSVRRLYNYFRPESYELSLQPDASSMQFRGKVTIHGQKINRPSQRLTFHQHGLIVSRATIIHHNKKIDTEIPVQRINYQKSFDEVRLHTEKLLYAGRYSITLEFSGTITKVMNGIYPCFSTENGKEKVIIATQFESHHAREAFPCVDEPEAKATFDLSLITPKDKSVIANTPAVTQTTDSDHTTTHFMTTPRMSTYLLAFVFGDLHFKEAKTKQGVLVRTYATKNNINFTEFALDVAVKCLDFYTDYFKIDYPLAKCDLVALPDFASGAMENWGCITFREHGLFVDPANTSVSSKQYVAMVVAHELAHQWFGNLVTMRWWTDLWLNEGFASWIEHLAVDTLFPEWQMWTQFAVDENSVALRLDALENTHPIEVPIHHPDEIHTIFDTISYSKGSSVINMLYHYLGANQFQRGLQHYLKTYTYSNAETLDLWASLTKVSERPIKEFMQNWTGKPGFPLVRVNVDSNRITLQQERFYINPSGSHHDHNVATAWSVPLLAGSDLPEVFAKPSITLPLPKKPFIKLNNEQRGFYRVVYNTEHVDQIAQYIHKGNLSPLDRLGILNDAFESAKAGYQETTRALSLLQHFIHEENAAVWDVIAEGVTSIRAVMDDEALREAMRPFIQELVNQQYKRLGWKPKKSESHFDSLLRPVIIGLNASTDEPTVVEEVHRQFNAMKSGTDILPDIRGLIYTTSARLGGKATLEKLVHFYQTTDSPEERLNLIAAITSFKSPSLIQQALSFIDTDMVRLQDVSYWVACSFTNRHAKALVWEWLILHWDWLEKNLGSDLSFYRFPIYAARSSSSIDFLNTYKKFFQKKVSPALERPIKQGIEIIEWQSAWRSRDRIKVKKFFKNWKVR